MLSKVPKQMLPDVASASETEFLVVHSQILVSTVQPNWGCKKRWNQANIHNNNEIHVFRSNIGLYVITIHNHHLPCHPNPYPYLGIWESLGDSHLILYSHNLPTEDGLQIRQKLMMWVYARRELGRYDECESWILCIFNANIKAQLYVNANMPSNCMSRYLDFCCGIDPYPYLYYWTPKFAFCKQHLCQG